MTVTIIKGRARRHSPCNEKSGVKPSNYKGSGSCTSYELSVCNYSALGGFPCTSCYSSKRTTLDIWNSSQKVPIHAKLKDSQEGPGLPLSCRAEMQLLTKGHLLIHTWEIDLLIQSVNLTYSEAGGWEVVTRGVVFSLHLFAHKVHPAFTYNQLMPRCENSTLFSSISEFLFYFTKSMISTCQVTKNER